MQYAIVRTIQQRGVFSPELVRLMTGEKEAVQFCRDQNNALHFLSQEHFSVVELLGEGDFTVLVHDQSCRLAKAFATEKDAQHFLRQELPKLGFPREWKFTLLARVSDHDTAGEEEADSCQEEEAPPQAKT